MKEGKTFSERHVFFFVLIFVIFLISLIKQENQDQ
jgi:hypothetical protein